MSSACRVSTLIANCPPTLHSGLTHAKDSDASSGRDCGRESDCQAGRTTLLQGISHRSVLNMYCIAGCRARCSCYSSFYFYESVLFKPT